MDRRDEIYHRIMDNVKIEHTGHFICDECGNEKPSPCWIWQGAKSGPENGTRETRGGGYPRMTLNSYTVAVHRVMYTHEHGYIPLKKQIDHVCRNRLCVNPAHLEMISHKENCKRRDMANGVVRKQRKRRKAAA